MSGLFLQLLGPQAICYCCFWVGVAESNGPVWGEPGEVKTRSRIHLTCR